MEVCPVCYWENADFSKEEEEEGLSSNTVSLEEARQNFKKFGAAEKFFTDYVRKPYPDEIKD